MILSTGGLHFWKETQTDFVHSSRSCLTTASCDREKHLEYKVHQACCNTVTVYHDKHVVQV